MFWSSLLLLFFVVSLVAAADLYKVLDRKSDIYVNRIVDTDLQFRTSS